MDISLEISMYPLTMDYVPAIDAFIDGLNQYNFKVITNTMSTQLFGDYDLIWEALKTEQKKAFETGQKFAISFKVINNNLDPVLKPHGDKYTA